ncbi:unnamed protein product, partial [Merluccius merluccius]
AVAASQQAVHAGPGADGRQAAHYGGTQDQRPQVCPSSLRPRPHAPEPRQPPARLPGLQLPV